MIFVSGVVATTDVVEACTGVNIAVMVGGFPRKEGMERKDVMSKNVAIYKSQASALEKHAAANCKVVSVLSRQNKYLWASNSRLFLNNRLWTHQKSWNATTFSPSKLYLVSLHDIYSRCISFIVI